MFAGDAVQELSEDQLAYVQQECINQFSKLQSEAFEQGLVPPTKFEIELLAPEEPAKIESLPVEIPAPEKEILAVVEETKITETPAVVEETITEPPKEKIEAVTTEEPAKEVEVELKNEVAEEDSKLKAEEVIKIEEVVEPVKEVSSE